MTSLAQYDRVCAAIAEATQIEDVVPLLDEFELAKVKAKQINDHKMLADATELELRTERRLGEILKAAKVAGLFKQGRQPKKKSQENFLDRPVLADAGIDNRLSRRAQARADMAPELFEDMVTETRERIAASGAKTLETSEVNGARTVMSSRVESTASLDYFPTPPWATRALMQCVFPLLQSPADYHELLAWEPACGEGHMAEVLREYFVRVMVSDVKDYGYPGMSIADFTKDQNGITGDWIITNPPFGELTEQFVLQAIKIARVGVAMFVRLQWLESVGRYEAVFRDHPPTVLAFFAERVPLHKGQWKPKGSTATSYIWLVWMKNKSALPPFWIPPGQRKGLTKPDDAERFTARPVIRKQDYRPASTESEIVPQPATFTEIAAFTDLTPKQAGVVS